MKFIIRADKIATAIKWATKNLGPVNSRTGMTLMKETVEVNGEIKKVLPLYRSGAHWVLKDLSRDGVDSTLDVNDDLLSKEDIALFERYISDTLSEHDTTIFTLKYL